MKKRDYIRYIMLFVMVALFMRSMTVSAASTTGNRVAPTPAPVIPPVTQEPRNSDLTLLQAETVLDSARWIQSFAKDKNFYYFVQMTNPAQGNLRVTRVRYHGPGKYSKDHMDLLGFGHGTNMDCSTYMGRTYLWIGSAMNSSQRTTAISCFRYIPNAVCRRYAGNTYKIRMKGKLRYATNVFPAVSDSGKYLFVRYTYSHRQYFQKYKIYKGCSIKTSKILACINVATTKGDFQGFDATDKYIYTIEGSPSAAFLASYDRTRVYQPTIVRRIKYSSKAQKVTYIRGASRMAFREPEGIKVFANGTKEILFVSNTLSFQKCNIYQLK